MKKKKKNRIILTELLITRGNKHPRPQPREYTNSTAQWQISYPYMPWTTSIYGYCTWRYVICSITYNMATSSSLLEFQILFRCFQISPVDCRCKPLKWHNNTFKHDLWAVWAMLQYKDRHMQVQVSWCAMLHMMVNVSYLLIPACYTNCM